MNIFQKIKKFFEVEQFNPTHFCFVDNKFVSCTIESNIDHLIKVKYFITDEFKTKTIQPYNIIPLFDDLNLCMILLDLKIETHKNKERLKYLLGGKYA